jgi:hypothetical protein
MLGASRVPRATDTAVISARVLSTGSAYDTRSRERVPLTGRPTGTLRRLTRLRLYDLLHQLAYGKQNPSPGVPERPRQASTVRMGRTKSLGKRRPVPGT